MDTTARPAGMHVAERKLVLDIIGERRNSENEKSSFISNGHVLVSGCRDVERPIEFSQRRRTEAGKPLEKGIPA